VNCLLIKVITPFLAGLILLLIVGYWK